MLDGLYVELILTVLAQSVLQNNVQRENRRALLAMRDQVEKMVNLLVTILWIKGNGILRHVSRSTYRLKY